MQRGRACREQNAPAQTFLRLLTLSRLQIRHLEAPLNSRLITLCGDGFQKKSPHILPRIKNSSMKRTSSQKNFIKAKNENLETRTSHIPWRLPKRLSL